jgi:hypothetical protein
MRYLYYSFVTHLKNIILKEMRSAVMKLIFAIIITTAMVFSVIQLGISLNIILSQFKDEFLLQLICYSIILSIGGFILYFMFMPKKNYDSNTLNDEIVLNPSHLALSFFTGFIEGFNQEK